MSDAAQAAARSRLYGLLAAAFRYPEAEDLALLQGGAGGWPDQAPGGGGGASRAAGAREGRATAEPGAARLASPAVEAAAGSGALGGAVAERVGALLDAAAVADLDTLRARYVATFGHVTLPDCPLYETACDGADAFAQAQTLADIVGYYGAFGLVVRPGVGERVDHLAVELEFMHYLAYREGYALAHHGPAQVALLREAQRHFLAGHLGRWAPEVARVVAARADGVLGAAARLLEGFLAEEAAHLGLTAAAASSEGIPPAPVLPRPGPAAPADAPPRPPETAPDPGRAVSPEGGAP